MGIEVIKVISETRPVKRIMRCLVALVLAGSLGACGLFDSGVEWRGGPYALLWIDTPDIISLNRDMGSGSSSGRIDTTVFAVGWDGRYLVAKQHPNGDRKATHYFIIDAERDRPRADPSEFLTGPLTASEFQKQSAALHLPGFSKTLSSLE